MEVTFLSKENVCELSGKEIYCWGGSNYSAINSLYEMLPTDANIKAIIDNASKRQGTILKIGNGIEVFTPEILKDIPEKNVAIVITCDYVEEIVEQIERETYLEKKECSIYNYASIRYEYQKYYYKKYENKPLENIIVFYSGLLGPEFSDNVRALFEYMITQKYNETYKIVWFVKNQRPPVEWESLSNVEFIPYQFSVSERKEEQEVFYYIFNLARFFFLSNGVLTDTRKDQIRVLLWHGCGFKTRASFPRCEERYEYTTVVSDLYADIHSKIFRMRKDQMLVTGYAKHDWLFQPYEEDIFSLLGKEKASKCVFWVPTFRVTEDPKSILNQYVLNSETGLPMVIYKYQMKKLNELLEEKNILLVIKLHLAQNNLLVSDCDYSNIVLLRNTDMLENDFMINRLLASADALITDYSSVAVDFLVLDRPMAFTLDDEEEYRNTRGFVFDNVRDYLPGKELIKFEDFCEFIIEIALNKDTTKEKRRKLAKKMLKYKDNQNCKRILNTLGIKKANNI